MASVSSFGSQIHNTGSGGERGGKLEESWKKEKSIFTVGWSEDR